MHVYIVFAHPSQNSFNQEVLEAFVSGLRESGHTYEVGNLYEMGFQSNLDIVQYRREIGGIPAAPISPDIEQEHQKIATAEALAFIYPVWWSDCPAILKGWFDRVWNYGYAYFYDDQEQRHTQIRIKKAIVICTAGHTEEHLIETGISESMQKIMLNDRLLGVGIPEAKLVVLGGMMPGIDTFKEKNLKKAFESGKNL